MALQEINIGASANDGSGDPLRTAMDKINENFGASGTGVFNVMHPDYGAVGNGVANDTTAINAASAAAALVGGVVKLPFTSASYNFTFTLPPAGVRWEYEGEGDLIDRSQIGGGAGMRAHKAMLVHFGGPHTSFSQVANHIRVIADGSTQNGPSSADFGQTIHVEKADYLTTTVAGEIDGLYVFVRQGGPNTGQKSAAGALVLDVVSVDGCGFAALYEGAVTVVNSSGVTQKRIDLQAGVLNSRDGDYYGYIFNCMNGTMGSCIYAKDDPGATWNDFLRAQNSSGILTFKVGMNGKITTKTDNTGNTEVNWLNTGGVVSCKNAGGDTLYTVNQTGFAAKAYVVVDTDGRTITAAETGTVFTNEGTTALDVFNLPAAAAGLEFTFIVQDADGIKAVAASGDTVRLAGAVSATAGYCQSTTIGSVVKLTAINATEWVATSIIGTWSVT